MEWIDKLNTPLTSLDVIKGAAGYLIYKWLMIGFEVGKRMYKNIKKKGMKKAIKDLKEVRGFLLTLQAMCVVNVEEPLKHISNAINSLIESEQLTKKQK